jgi:nitrate reductase NapAB chaperone NapD
MPNAESDLPVTVLVDPDRYDAVVRALTAADDVSIEAEQRAIGTITARVAAKHVATLRGIDGVLAVETQRNIQLPPPDADIQ